MTHDKPCAEGCHGTPADTERPNPMGPHVQVITGWLDDNGCLLPDPDGGCTAVTPPLGPSERRTGGRPCLTAHVHLPPRTV